MSRADQINILLYREYIKEDCVLVCSLYSTRIITRIVAQPVIIVATVSLIQFARFLASAFVSRLAEFIQLPIQISFNFWILVRNQSLTVFSLLDDVFLHRLRLRVVTQCQNHFQIAPACRNAVSRCRALIVFPYASLFLPPQTSH